MGAVVETNDSSAMGPKNETTSTAHKAWHQASENYFQDLKSNEICHFVFGISKPFRIISPSVNGNIYHFLFIIVLWKQIICFLLSQVHM
jgi:hypothetical protein